MSDATREPLEHEPPALRCTGCKHYYITHDLQFPYGCRAFGFKSVRQPVLDVREASWRKCLLFEARN